MLTVINRPITFSEWIKKRPFTENQRQAKVEAYRILYDEYYPALVVYASTFLASDEVAEDIVQELFVSMWEKRVTFVSFPAFKTYLYKFIKNSAPELSETSGVEERYKEALQNNLSDEELDEEELDREEEYRHLFQAIDKLPSRCREIFLLSLEGKKQRNRRNVTNIHRRLLKLKNQGYKSIEKCSGILFSFLFSVYR